MTEARKKSNQMKLVSKSKAYCKKVLPYLSIIRRHCDKLELLVEDELWPLPKYRELLFIN
jgi:glutamine synthetase